MNLVVFSPQILVVLFYTVSRDPAHCIFKDQLGYFHLSQRKLFIFSFFSNLILLESSSQTAVIVNMTNLFNSTQWDTVSRSSWTGCTNVMSTVWSILNHKFVQSWLSWQPSSEAHFLPAVFAIILLPLKAINVFKLKPYQYFSSSSFL